MSVNKGGYPSWPPLILFWNTYPEPRTFQLICSVDAPLPELCEVCEALEKKALHVTPESVQEADCQWMYSIKILKGSVQSVQVMYEPDKKWRCESYFWGLSRLGIQQACMWCSADPLCQQFDSGKSGYTPSLFNLGNIGETESWPHHRSCDILCWQKKETIMKREG